MAKGVPNLDARFDTIDGWVETNLYCPFCGARCNLANGTREKKTRGILMKTGLNENNEYQCDKCEERFTLELLVEAARGSG